MKDILKKISTALLIIPGLVLLVGLATPVAAVTCDPANPNTSIADGATCAKSNSQPTTLFGGDGSVFKRITSILLFLVGAIAVIMLIIGGIRYVVSGGDQSQVTAAKNTILYAIVGIIVAFLSYAAIDFITKSLLTT